MGQAAGFLQRQARRLSLPHASEKDRTSGLTQFGRALYELNIDIICANTP